MDQKTGHYLYKVFSAVVYIASVLDMITFGASAAGAVFRLVLLRFHIFLWSVGFSRFSGLVRFSHSAERMFNCLMADGYPA